MTGSNAVRKNRAVAAFVSGLTVLLMLFPAALMAQDNTDAGPVYELRIYTTNPGKLPALHARFRDHTLALFAKHGIESLYFWDVLEPAAGEDAANTLVYLVRHPGRAAAAAAWQAFLNDPEWQRVARESERDGPLLAGPPVSLFMRAADFAPPLEAPNAGSKAPARLFELRKYNTGVDGLPGTIDRFKAGEAALFSKHGMPPIIYWTALDNSSFIYLLAHKDRETARANWQAFFADFRQFFQEYNARSAAQQNAPPQGGPPPRMTSEIRYLIPTDYSPRR